MLKVLEESKTDVHPSVRPSVRPVQVCGDAAEQVYDGIVHSDSRLVDELSLL